MIGLGYVGLPLLPAFQRGGFPRHRLRRRSEEDRALQRGENYLKHLGEDYVSRWSAVGAVRRDHRLRAGWANADAIISCVPTPLGTHLRAGPELRRADAPIDIAKTLRKGSSSCWNRRTYPRHHARGHAAALRSARGCKCGSRFLPRLFARARRPGRKDLNTQTIPKLVGGIDPAQRRTRRRRSIARRSSRSSRSRSAEVAEAAKLLENIYRAVNIALVNEMKMVLDGDGHRRLGSDRAPPAPSRSASRRSTPARGSAGTASRSIRSTSPGRPARSGMPTRFIELAGEINRHMPDYVVQRTVLALNDRGKAVKGAKILVLGLAYKPDVDDVRESPSFELIEKLEHLGARCRLPRPARPRDAQDAAPRSADEEHRADAAVAEELRLRAVATHHAAYDWQMVADNAKLIVDTRNAMQNVKGRRDHIVQA